jgi:glycosyltransferase involved in cell wall biosynthesis
LQSYGLESGKYFLQITRLEPDNLPLETVKGFCESGLAKTGYKCVIVGFKDKTPYALRLKSYDQRDGVLILPSNYDPKVLYTLRNNCYCYIHGNSVGGTNPALLEAMNSCARIMAVDVLFNGEVLAEYGYFFSPENLVKKFQESVSFPDLRDGLRKRSQNTYQWDAVGRSYIAIVKNTDPKYSPMKLY